MTYRAPVEDIAFTLKHAAGTDSSGRTDSAPQRYQVHTADRFDGVIQPKG